MVTWIERFPQAYLEWVQAGGIENNFRAHALAINLDIPVFSDYQFMKAQLKTVQIQFAHVEKEYHQMANQEPVFIPRTGRAADISYLTEEIDQAFCANLKSLGVDLVIVGLQDLALANSQLSVLLAAQMKIHAYIWPQIKDLAVYMPQVHGLMLRYAIPYIWVDVEDDSNNIREAIAWLDNNYQYRTGIYTSAYMWHTCMGDSEDFSHLPLWYAHYDYVNTLWPFKPFAGWTIPTMKQYDARNSRYDLDVYDPDLLF
jgi:hypothetical protein